MKWLFFGALAALSWVLRSFGVDPVQAGAGSALLALGCLLVGAALAGELAARARLPRLTGYLLLGMVAGPYALQLETASDAHLLRPFEELALGLIALTAGGEFRIETIRRRFRALIAITAVHAVAILLFVAAVMWVLLHATGLLGEVSGSELLAASALLGVIAVAVSPATTIAIITETESRGDLTETVLGVTILKDLVILLLFTWVSALATGWVQGEPVSLGTLHGVGLEIVLSLLVGCLLGLLLGAFITKAGQHAELTVVLLALVSAEIGAGTDLEHLLICMAAGFTVRNVFPAIASGFIEALERSSPPIYMIFFALIGGGLDLHIFSLVWLPAVVFVAARLVAVWLSTGPPAALAGAEPVVVRLAWLGFVAQAGLSLGLAVRIRHSFAGIGESVATLLVAAVIINQLAGPILWAWALRRAGETRSAATSR